ncbi:MAG: fumarylacetoacetate hydrolase family protein [bacterium]
MPLVHITDTNEHLEVKKILCIGRNYAGHAKEMNASIPENPLFFLKPATAIIHDGETVRVPEISKEVHHEVEMLVLIGTGGTNISPADSLRHVAGYGIGLDMTMRDVQAEAKKKGTPWTLAKGFDTSAPVSSFVSASRIQNPHELGVKLTVNRAPRQNGCTDQFLFRIEELIAYLSRFITLERGDIIFTGTPEGVAQTVSGDELHAELSLPSGEVLSSLTVRVQ